MSASRFAYVRGEPDINESPITATWQPSAPPSPMVGSGHAVTFVDRPPSRYLSSILVS